MEYGYSFDIAKLANAFQRGREKLDIEYADLAATMGMTVEELRLWERDFWGAGDRLAEQMRERRRERLARSGLRLVKG